MSEQAAFQFDSGGIIRRTEARRGAIEDVGPFKSKGKDNDGILWHEMFKQLAATAQTKTYTPMQTAEKELAGKDTAPRELEQLDIFVWKWNVEGQNLKGPPVEVKGIATYEWLAGKFYLIAKWSRKFENSTHIGIGITGFDGSTGCFKTNNYDNIGFAREYKLTSRRLTWKFSGTHERGTMEFTPDGRSFTEYWEVSEDGSNWEPLCRLNGSKVN